MSLRTYAAAILCTAALITFAGCVHVPDKPYQLSSTIVPPELHNAPSSRIEPGRMRSPKVVDFPVSVAPIEFNKNGQRFGCTAPSGVDCELKRAEDYISAARHVLAEEPGKQLVVLTYVHGWHHDASWHSYNFRNFARMVDCLNWGAPTFKKLYRDAEMAGPNPVSCEHEVTNPNVRYLGVYIGWPGESVVGLGSAATLPSEHATALKVSKGQVGPTINRLIVASKVGPNPARFILIGHSFGGLIAGRVTASSLLPQFENERNSELASCGDGTTGHRNSADLVVLVNAADNSVRPADLIREMKADKAVSPTYFCQTNAAGPGKAIDRPIIVSLHTPSDGATGGEGAFALKFSHDDDNYVHRSDLDSMTFEGGALEQNPGFNMMKSNPINHLVALHNTCYLDQEKTGDLLCDRVDDLIYSVKKTVYEEVMGHPLSIPPTVGKPDPYYHAVYEIILSVCRKSNESADDSEFKAPACDPALSAQREKLTTALLGKLSDYFAVPDPMPGNRATILLDLYKRLELSCATGAWIREKNGSLCSASAPGDLSHVKQNAVWNDTPYWFVNVSYEIIKEHSGFWNQNVFDLITDISQQSPVTPAKP